MPRVVPAFSIMMALLLTAALFGIANPAIPKAQPRFDEIVMDFGACYYCWHRHIPEPTWRDIERLRKEPPPRKAMPMYPAPPGWNRA